MKKSFIYMLAAVALMACSKSAKTTGMTDRVEQVRTTVLQPREIEREISVSTNLQGYITQNVAPSITGKIEHIYCEVGDKKAAGADLVRMDQTQYKTTKITLANLEIEKNRIEQVRRPSSSMTRSRRSITLRKSSWISSIRIPMSKRLLAESSLPRRMKTVSCTAVNRSWCSPRSTNSKHW